VVTRGEVWWYEHPEAGRRPVLVLARDVAIPVLNQVIAVPLTTTVRDIPTEVLLDEDDGLPRRCVATLDNITTVRLSLLTGRITRLRPERLQDVCAALAHATGCRVASTTHGG
jgi:mRNA interferase MazF